MLYFHSFVPPFVSIDENATLTVSDQWRAHGDTEVRLSFARLTPFQETRQELCGRRFRLEMRRRRND